MSTFDEIRAMGWRDQCIALEDCTDPVIVDLVMRAEIERAPSRDSIVRRARSRLEELPALPTDPREEVEEAPEPPPEFEELASEEAASPGSPEEPPPKKAPRAVPTAAVVQTGGQVKVRCIVSRDKSVWHGPRQCHLVPGRIMEFPRATADYLAGKKLVRRVR